MDQHARLSLDPAQKGKKGVRSTPIVALVQVYNIALDTVTGGVADGGRDAS